MGCLILLGMLWSSFAFVAHERSVLEQRERSALAASTAKGFSEYVALHLMDLDKVLVSARDAFSRNGTAPTQVTLARELGPIASQLLQISFADERGRVIASSLPFRSGVSIADRPHFQVFQRDAHDRPFLSETVVGRVSGKVSLQLVRPILGAAGAFCGVAVASIDPVQWQKYFGSLDALSGGGKVAVVGRDDGVVRVRFTESQITWGRSMQANAHWEEVASGVAGEFQTQRAIDSETRLVGYHQVEGYPLVVLVSGKQPPWLSTGIAMAATFGLAFSIVLIRYVQARVRRIRERELFIERLETSRQREKEANQMKSRFLASVSHELRTPLNAILGFSELLRDVPDHPENVRRADLIHSSGKHLHALLDTLLDLAKIEAGRMHVHRTPIDLVEMVRTASETHAASAARKGLPLAVAIDVPNDCTVTALTDGTKLLQVLNNVLDNAVKFTQEGRIDVSASLEHDVFFVRVDDTGRGISPELLPYVFDRFSTAAGADKTHEAGTGLGLALSRDLMRLLGGSIHLHRRAEGGTRAVIRLPAARLRKI